MKTNEELKATKCKNCIYEWQCFDIEDPQIRELCNDQKKPRNDDVVPAWGEMSYYRTTMKSNLERMRNEKAHRGNY